MTLEPHKYSVGGWGAWTLIDTVGGGKGGGG